MQRRFFLKAVAALSTVPLIKVPDFRVIEPQEIILPNEDWFANIRELSDYEIQTDSTIYRWTLTDGHNEWGVDFRATPRVLAIARREAAIVLRDSLIHDGVDLRDLKPFARLPGPIYYS